MGLGYSASKPVTSVTGRKYGWVRGHKNINDVYHGFSTNALTPDAVDLRPKCPAIYNQLTLGSCVAHATAGAVEFDIIKNGGDAATPSRLFIYYNARDLDGTTSLDVGTTIHSGVKGASLFGACPEALWPYDVNKFALKAPATCYSDAEKCRVADAKVMWVRHTLSDLRSALAAGYPLICGIAVYASFETPETMGSGVVKLPAKGETLLGGHAILIVGYDNAKQQFIFRNSWGPEWGDKGYGYLPYQYLLDPSMADEFCTVTGLLQQPLQNKGVTNKPVAK
jgi:C1A family cysteine protease